MIFLVLESEDGAEYIVNASCIETVCERSDNGLTSIGLASGRYVQVLDSVDRVKKLIAEAKKRGAE
ncbi:MAG: flagellar FlbD family protein [Pirellulaceae bacterium]|jgi:uncharacterized protein YlzI (FlbEa/FlbD family)